MATIRLTLAVLLALLPEHAGSAEVSQPNFIVFFTDDLGYHDVGCFGSETIETPNLDRLAAEGLRLTSFCAQPVCGVSRAALMTGCYPMRIAEPGNTKSGHPVLHPQEVTVAEVLRSAGYRTGLIGKWHLAGGRREAYPAELMPVGQGFDEFFGTPLHNGFTRTVQENSFKTQLMRGNQILDDFLDQQEMNQLTTRYTEEAVRFVREHHQRPFFLYLAHNMPHVPLGVSERFRGTSRQGLYGDVIQELDWSMGEVLRTLQELNIDERTLVIFTSDNGPWIEEHLAGEGCADAYYGSADPLRGSKMMTWEGGLRVPCIARWPTKIPAGTVCNEMATTMDILPTLAGLAGAKPPQDRHVDGHDIWPLLSGQPGAETPHQAFFYYAFVHLQAVRSGRWKLVLPRPARPPWTSWSARMIDAVAEPELYDLEADVGEQKDVAGEQPEVVAELMRLVTDARADLGDYDRIGKGARFFDPGWRRRESARWLPPPEPEPTDGGGPYPFSFDFSDAIGHEPGVTRRDPSDVICVDDTYYVWYSKVTRGPGIYRYPSGYSADVWWATSPDGKRWTEQGQALGKGPVGAWDEHGVFTPNILRFQDKYSLYYTAVAAGHDETTPTRIGVAISGSPEGPWVRFSENPVLVPSEDSKLFDSMRVDDAALIVREGKIWLYYKGRQIDHSPGETKMGLAIANHPTGPFMKHEAAPLHAGHEVLVWPHGDGVASMATAAGPRTIYFAKDGLSFQPRNAVASAPPAPGAYRADDFVNDGRGEGIQWGLCHGSLDGDVFLRRFDCRFTPIDVAAVRRGPQPVPYDQRPPLGNLRFDFETGDLQGWTVVEGKFDLLVCDRPALPQWPHVPFNKQGKYHLSTVAKCGGKGTDDAMTGVLQSPEFIIQGPQMSFLVGGGDSDATYVALCSTEGEELKRAGGTNSPVLRRVVWDVIDYRDRRVFLEIVDRKQRSWAHLTFDDLSCEGQIATAGQSGR